MAKVIRNRWVYRPDNRWTRYLPRRNDAVKEHIYDMKIDEASENAPKLWMAWLYRNVSGEPKWTKERVEKIFGKDYKVGRMEIFRNSPLVNEELWTIKHLIEIRPVDFVNGEPSEDDIYSMKLHPNGKCEITETAHVSSYKQLKLFEETKQFTKRDIARDLARKEHRFQPIHEANVHTPSNITIVK
ncbi:unnamed protein product [Caenorhabditis bovis]|uniref:39S ribosomal protein L30, mitochondrial n=1 Tax=Caenorhabditis bovis TaxID=2654633 RepID=A0A8S1EJ06_9PELO|nr:unnamed protein product [Caenorhabditis bovis]